MPLSSADGQEDCLPVEIQKGMVLSVDLEEIVEEISELGGFISEHIDAAVENTMDYVKAEMTATVETLEKTVEEAVGEFVDLAKTKRELKWWQHKWWQSKQRLDKRMARGRKRYNQGSLKIVSIVIGVAWFFIQTLQPVLNHTGCSKSFLERASVGLAWPAGHYCGPSNGQEYRRKPRDPLDAICAQHDYCIEHTLFPDDEGRLMRIYPKGETDEEGKMRCGMRLGSWRKRDWGALIMACDQQLVKSVWGGFQCSSALPRSKFCFDDSLIGQSPCRDQYAWYHPLHVPCRITAFSIRHFEQRKIRKTNAHLNVTLAVGGFEDEEEMPTEAAAEANDDNCAIH